MNDTFTGNNPAVSMTKERIGEALIREFVLRIQQAPNHWKLMTEAQQNATLDEVANRVDQLIDEAVNLIAAEGRDSISVICDKITLKDGQMQIVLTGIPQDSDGMHKMVDCTGKSLRLVMFEPANFKEGMREIRGESDYPELPL